MALDEATRDRIERLIQSNEVMLFMKGTRDAPQCGFSATVVRLLDSLVPEYATHDVLSDPAVRDGIKTYSAWPTIPQLYVAGEFIGGCDIVQELYESGELPQKLGISLEDAGEPALRITEKAAEALRQAREQQGGEGLEVHLTIDARSQTSLSLAPVQPGERKVDASGVALYLDPLTAMRADGVVIDVVETPGGQSFLVNVPGAPAVRVMQPEELKRLLDAGQRFELVDVRTPEERATASIPGSTLLTDEERARLESLPKDALLVFHCHYGGRSQAAAEHIAKLGFTRAHNLVGGIDAWSERVDPSVPRY